jgi:ATP-dependent DNA helicase RecG
VNDKELELILDEGEGFRIEFKESLKNIDKEIVAFANSSGGRIFIGIGDDNIVTGINITNKLKSQVQDMANNCQPPVDVLIEEFGNILIINVLEIVDKPCKCSAGFYTRIGPNSQKLDRNDIIEFFQSEGKIRFDELVNLRFDYDTHFDHAKFEGFLRLAGISKILDTPSMLENLGVAEKQEGKLIFNNSGILFFSKNLDDIYSNTAVTCALFDGTEKIDILDRRDFNEDLISNIDGTMIFLKRYLAVKYEMTGEPQRKEIPEIPFDALREAVINAVAHRDYFEKGTNVMVEIFDDRVEITNFGGLVKGLKPEDFGKRSMPRNPKIAGLLNRVEYIEKMGTGINKIKKMVKAAGLPLVEFEYNTFFSVIFKRPALKKPAVLDEGDEVFEKIRVALDDAINEELIERVSDGVKSRLINELYFIEQNGFITSNIIESTRNISARSAKRDLSILKNLGIVIFEGSKKTGAYVLTTKGKNLIK